MQMSQAKELLMLQKHTGHCLLYYSAALVSCMQARLAQPASSTAQNELSCLLHSTGAASHMQEDGPYPEGAYRQAATLAYPQGDSWLPVSRAQPSVSGPSRSGFSGSYHISHHIDDSSETSNWTYYPRQQQPAFHDQIWPQQQQQQQQFMPQYEQSFPHNEQRLPQLQPQQQQWQQPQVMPDYEQRPSQPQHAPSQYAPAPSSYDQQPSQYEQATSQSPQAHAQPEHFSSQHEQESSQHEQPPARYEQAFSQLEQAPAQHEHLPLQYEQAQDPVQQFSSHHQQALSQRETPPRHEQASSQQEQRAPQHEQRQRSGEQTEDQQAPLYPDAPQQHSGSDRSHDDRSGGIGHNPVEKVDTSGSRSFIHEAAESASSEPPVPQRSLKHGGDVEGAAQSTAEQHPATQADSNSGMRYGWAPPSSLWGRATAAAGSLAAAFTGTSEAGMTAGAAAGRAGTPEAASAAPQKVDTAGKARDETTGGVYADTAERGIADTSGGAELQRAWSSYASPDTTQEGYGWSRPATHANFARGDSSTSGHTHSAAKQLVPGMVESCACSYVQGIGVILFEIGTTKLCFCVKLLSGRLSLRAGLR